MPTERQTGTTSNGVMTILTAAFWPAGSFMNLAQYNARFLETIDLSLLKVPGSSRPNYGLSPHGK